MSHVKLQHDFAKFLKQNYYLEALRYNSDSACNQKNQIAVALGMAPALGN